ncbi:M56 family metallopeptidase [uncultured Nocardioides sp.]|uniref:M56 family metallopeptidase n=1 Tax=uncultured Nocardioides sp. TaxID=198441 RepID=UPI0026270AE9|nr:M56 family metallopeptidase [uncultured Nocardioides sp.]
MATPLLLGALAVLLAGPVPALLARLPRTRTTPRAAMVLWQAVALAAVLAALGAGLSLVTSTAWRRAPDLAPYAIATAALLVTVLVLGRLLVSGHLVGTDLRALRRRHRDQVDLLAREDERVTGAAAVRVLEHDLPLAYCVPGRKVERVVLSVGALDRLSPDEVTAVLAHERAHLQARHDLVLEAFGVLHHAFPRWVSSAAALAEVRLLVEILADRAAARDGRRRALGSALVTLAEGRVAGPDYALAAAGSDPSLLVRVRLIGDRGPHRLQAALLLTLAGAVLVVPTAFVVLPWLTGLN